MQERSREVVGSLLLELSFHGHLHLLQVRRQPPSSDDFACLGSHPSLANRPGATIAVIVARCQKRSSKLRVLFDPFEPRSLQQKRLRLNYKFGTAMNYHCLKWS